MSMLESIIELLSTDYAGFFMLSLITMFGLYVSIKDKNVTFESMKKYFPVFLGLVFCISVIIGLTYLNEKYASEYVKNKEEEKIEKINDIVKAVPVHDYYVKSGNYYSYDFDTTFNVLLNNKLIGIEIDKVSYSNYYDVKLIYNKYLIEYDYYFQIKFEQKEEIDDIVVINYNGEKTYFDDYMNTSLSDKTKKRLMKITKTIIHDKISG